MPMTCARHMESEMDQKITVVAVDDSQIVLSHLTRLLSEMEGVEVVGTAKDGMEAIRIVNEAKPDLVLMDIVMPGMDGLTALRTLRSTTPDTRVAMVSSVGGSSTRAEEAFRLGAIQVIGKPFDASQLDALLVSERAEKVARTGKGAS